MLTLCTGFGKRISWGEDASIPAGHKMTFKDALTISSSDFFFRILLPNWVMGLTKRTERCRLAFDELRVKSTILNPSIIC